jgi:hypothetical protein
MHNKITLIIILIKIIIMKVNKIKYQILLKKMTTWKIMILFRKKLNLNLLIIIILWKRRKKNRDHNLMLLKQKKLKIKKD